MPNKFLMQKRGGLLAAVTCVAGLLGIGSPAQAGDCRVSGGLSVSVGFPIGDRGYVSIGSSRGYGYSYRSSVNYRYGYGYGDRYGYGDCGPRVRYVYRPISAVCYEPWGYGYRSRYDLDYRYSAVGGRSSGVGRYASASDQRVRTVQSDYAAAGPQQTVSVDSSFASVEPFADALAPAADPAPRRMLHTRQGTAVATTRPTQADNAASAAQAWATLEHGDAPAAQRAFARLIAQQPRDAAAKVGYGLASAQQGETARAERAFAAATAADDAVWDRLATQPSARSAAEQLQQEASFIPTAAFRNALDRLADGPAQDALSLGAARR